MVQTEKEAFWYDHLTPEQQSAYAELLANLDSSKLLLAGHDDRHTLLRFLKARQWNPQRAQQMYLDMAKWRQDTNVDKLYAEFEFEHKETLQSIYPHFYHKTDKFGRPLYIELLGKTYATKILELTDLDTMVKHHIKEWEVFEREILPACSKMANRKIISNAVIIDLSGLHIMNFNRAAQRIMKSVCKIDQDYYPEHLGQMFIVNAPFIFQSIWAVVSPMLEERTRRKIILLGGSYVDKVLSLIPKDNLPTVLGGDSEL